MCVSNALGWRLTSDFLCATVCAGCNILLCCCGGGMRGETFDSRLESLSDARQGERANVAFTLLTGMRACADDADWRQCLGLAQYSSCMHTCTLSRSFAKSTTHYDKQVPLASVTLASRWRTQTTRKAPAGTRGTSKWPSGPPWVSIDSICFSLCSLWFSRSSSIYLSLCPPCVHSLSLKSLPLNFESPGYGLTALYTQGERSWGFRGYYSGLG